MFNPSALDNDKPAEFSGVSKADIYDELNGQFFLLDIDCRATIRSYLIKIGRGEGFRIACQDILAFEVNLTPEEKVKSSFYNLTVLRERASKLLEQLGQNPFGFTPGKIGRAHV